MAQTSKPVGQSAPRAAKTKAAAQAQQPAGWPATRAQAQPEGLACTEKNQVSKDLGAQAQPEGLACTEKNQVSKDLRAQAQPEGLACTEKNKVSNDLRTRAQPEGLACTDKSQAPINTSPDARTPKVPPPPPGVEKNLDNYKLIMCNKSKAKIEKVIEDW